MLASLGELWNVVLLTTFIFFVFAVTVACEPLPACQVSRLKKDSPPPSPLPFNPSPRPSPLTHNTLTLPPLHYSHQVLGMELFQGMGAFRCVDVSSYDPVTAPSSW